MSRQTSRTYAQVQSLLAKIFSALFSLNEISGLLKDDEHRKDKLGKAWRRVQDLG
jgi:hypothetical protein